jgi:O-antigen/teichoic acid export membrane protein
MKHGLTVSVGKAISQVAGLVSLAILTRQLGPSLFGVLALIRTVAMVTEAYANFNTWQAILKYGSDAIAAGNRVNVQRVIKLAMVIDVTTAAIAAVVIVGIAFLVPSAFGWSMHESLLCSAYALTVLTRVAGTCDGIYRLCNAYRTQAIGDVLQATAPMLAIVGAASLKLGFDGAVIALIIGEVTGNIIDMAMSFYVAAQHGYGGWSRTSLAGIRATFPGIRHFIVATNVQLTVKKTQVELDMIVVGSMLGRAASGLFKVVKQLGRAPSLVFMPFEQVLFAELAQRAAEKDYRGFRSLLRKFSAVVFLGAVGIWVVVAVISRPIVEVLAGEQFVAAVPALRIYLLAMAMSVAATPTQRALIALGRPGTLLAFDLAALAVSLVTTIAGAYYWGIEGVAAAVLLHKVMQLVWASWLVGHVIRKQRSAATVPQPVPAQA